MRNSVKYATIITAIFFLSALVAILIVMFFPDFLPIEIATREGMIERARSDLNVLFFSLLFNNLFISFIMITSSLTRQKIIPAAIIASNGFSIGGTLFKAVQIYGIPIIFSFIPHAVIELPAIILTGTLAFIAIDAIKEVSPYSTLKEYLSARLKIPRETMNHYIFEPYFKYVVPMLIVAAAIEAYISIHLLTFMVGFV